MDQNYSKKVAVLAYHKIGEPSIKGWHTWNYVPDKVFEKQLQYLKDDAWQVIDEKQFLDGLDQPETLPHKAALITFDDGYRSNLEVAVPILKRFSYPAIVFVPTAFIGGYNAFDAEISFEPKESICTWNELRALERNKVSVQSHGVNHFHFSELSLKQLLEEIQQSKKILEENLDKPINLFSFPYGDNKKDSIEVEKVLSEQGFKAAFLYGGPSVKFPLSSPFNLSRIPVGPDTDFRIVLNL